MWATAETKSQKAGKRDQRNCSTPGLRRCSTVAPDAARSGTSGPCNCTLQARSDSGGWARQVVHCSKCRMERRGLDHILWSGSEAGSTAHHAVPASMWRHLPAPLPPLAVASAHNTAFRKLNLTVRNTVLSAFPPLPLKKQGPSFFSEISVGILRRCSRRTDAVLRTRTR